jgi:hypothetical protein
MMGRPDRNHTEDRAFGLSALKTSLVVGTVLTVINHPDLLRVPLTPHVLLQCVLNYVVPFLVAGYSRHTLLRRASTRQLDL